MAPRVRKPSRKAQEDDDSGSEGVQLVEEGEGSDEDFDVEDESDDEKPRKKKVGEPVACRPASTGPRAQVCIGTPARHRTWRNSHDNTSKGPAAQAHFRVRLRLQDHACPAQFCPAGRSQEASSQEGRCCQEGTRQEKEGRGTRATAGMTLGRQGSSCCATSVSHPAAENMLARWAWLQDLEPEEDDDEEEIPKAKRKAPVKKEHAAKKSAAKRKKEVSGHP